MIQLTRAIPLVALVGFLFLIGLGGCSAASEGLSDQESVAADKTALAIGYAQGDSIDSVTQDMTLPTTGASGTVIAWSSSNTGVIANDGMVTRPAVDAADASVTLTATIEKNGVNDTKTFTLTVIKKDQVDIANLDSAAFSLTVANTTVTALTGGTHTATVGGSLSLTAGTDYNLSITGTGVSSGAVSIANDGTITIADSIAVSDGGTYTVTAAGTGKYRGTRSVTFTLTVNSIDITTVQGYSISVADQTVPPLQESTFSVTINNVGLIAGTDYDLSIEKDGALVTAVTIDNSGQVSIAKTIDTGETGTYTVTAAGTGKYTGKKAVDFVLTVVYSVGNTGPAGGKIFYVNTDPAIVDWTYLEAAPSDLPSATWGKDAAAGTTGTAIGTGESNTATIVDVLGANGGYNGESAYAAKICSDYKVNHNGVDYDDWFLPSKDELDELYKQKDVVGNFASSAYWSSSEYNSAGAWGQEFDRGSKSAYGKEGIAPVRAVRAF